MTQTDQVKKLWGNLDKEQHQETIAYLTKEAAYFLSQQSSLTSFQTFRQFQRDGERSTYEKAYFERRKRLTTFGLLSSIEPENKQYLQALENEIWQICQEFTWCLPAHIDQQKEEQIYVSYQQSQTLEYTIDLFAAETAFSLAEIIYLLEDHLDPFLIEKIKIEIDRRVLSNFINNGPFHWESASHNWASVCAGSVGAAAIYMLEDQEQLAKIIDRVLDSMEHYLSGFKADGACTEGYTYWQYGFGYFVYFMDLLERVTGERYKLFNSNKIRKIAQFQQHIFLSGNHLINFSDAPSFAQPMLGFTHYLQQKFPEVHLPVKEIGQKEIVDHCGRWAPAFRELQWYDVGKQGSNWRDANVLWEPSAILMTRFQCNEETYAFAAKGGHNDEPHNHNDIGHFLLFGGEEVFLKDLGAGQYNQAYFSEQRYDFICNSSYGHSVPVINGQTQFAGKEYQATVQQADHCRNQTIFQLHMHKAYNDPTLLRLNRTFIFDRDRHPALTLTDRFRFTDEPSSLIEHFILLDMPYVIEDSQIVLKGAKQSLKIVYDSNMIPQIRRKTFTNHQGKEEAFLQLQLSLEDLKTEIAATIVFQFC
ncbi:heparinase II/III domain-containing protein [Gracilibacillus phocaeensis]|uniref:heparinase II/III domain-containing protein n=1 Tax=Gracilibacillus phocaeensis TaxID=2042304 RepID=UPI0010307853|nr:heparinase II/III family protein [Gracilibacillus phocaeensis]